MTRDDAIERLKTDIYKYADFTENPNENEFWMAFDMAIKALEQQTCEDCISRQAVLDIFADNADVTRPYSTAWEEVKALPSVNPQPICEEREKGGCPYYAG